MSLARAALAKNLHPTASLGGGGVGEDWGSILRSPGGLVLGARDIQESPSLGPHERGTGSPRQEPSCFGPSPGISVPQPPRGGRGGRELWLRFEVPGPASMLRGVRKCPGPCWAPAPPVSSANSYKKLHPASHSFPVTESLRKGIDTANGHRKRAVSWSIGGPQCVKLCLEREDV